MLELPVLISPLEPLLPLPMLLLELELLLDPLLDEPPMLELPDEPPDELLGELLEEPEVPPGVPLPIAWYSDWLNFPSLSVSYLLKFWESCLSSFTSDLLSDPSPFLSSRLKVCMSAVPVLDPIDELPDELPVLLLPLPVWAIATAETRDIAIARTKDFFIAKLSLLERLKDIAPNARA